MAPELIKMAQKSANALAEIGSRLLKITPLVETGRAALAKAAGLLAEDADAAIVILTGASALVPAAMFVNHLLSGTPLLPGAVSAGGPLIDNVFANAFQPQVAAPLKDALRDFSVCFDSHDDAINMFRLCAQEDDATWKAWSKHKDRGGDAAKEASKRLNAAIGKVLEAERVHRLCLVDVESPLQGERRREVMQSVRTAIEEVDHASQALSEMRDAVALEEAIVRDAIRKFLDPAMEEPEENDDESLAVAHGVEQLVVDIGLLVGEVKAFLRHIKAVLLRASAKPLAGDSAHAGDILFDDVVALESDGHLLPETDIAAATKLVDGVFAASPSEQALPAARDIGVASAVNAESFLEAHMVDVGSLEAAIAVCGRLFTLCAAPLGFEPAGDERARRWRHHLIDAIVRAKEAYVRLNTAYHNTKENGDCVGEAVAEAKEILRQVVDEAEEAFDELGEMSNALGTDLKTLWVILDSNPAPGEPIHEDPLLQRHVDDCYSNPAPGEPIHHDPRLQRQVVFHFPGSLSSLLK